MLNPLREVVFDLKQRIKVARLVSLFLDFDGTLVPINADPDFPRLDPGATETLRTVATQQFLVTTIISGRALQDLCPRIGLKSLIYAGNHGLEICGRNLRFMEPHAAARREELEQLCDGLRGQLRPIPGVLVEFKGLTGSVHYRRCAKSDYPAVEDAVHAAVSRTGKLFRLNHGRKVLEILPRTGWHKGTAARWINGQLGEKNVLSIYLGDDTSDEDAFCMMPEAVTIRVGAVRATCARYALPDPTAVHEFLHWLAIQEPEWARKG